ncbi:putative protein FAM63B-like [Capsicum annuum]|nr:putative protein FAM63B-like [Capsicum annuum]
MTRKLEFLEDSKRKLLGQGLESSTLDELEQVEEQLERGLSNIRARKNLLFREQIAQLKEESEMLSLTLTTIAKEKKDDGRQIMEVETELFIGLPDTRKNSY